MLYPQAYIDACRAQIDDQVAQHCRLVQTARRAYGTLESAIDAFDRQFFNNLVLVLDMSFCHHSRGTEQQDGNALNEVRILCTSLLEHDGRLAADKTVKLPPDRSVLGLAVGDRIAMDADGFSRLAAAFFEEIERRYAAS